MADQRTEVTEIITGLAMLGYQDVHRALEVRPRHITHVDEIVFDRLDAALASGRYATEFDLAWENGAAFARSPLALRGRPPWTLEWKGHHRPASKSIETIPADLRIDHVYLISCKYRSRILHNAGPTALFDHNLAPPGPVARTDWFHHIAPDHYRAIWEPTFNQAGIPPGVTPNHTTALHRQHIQQALDRAPIDTTSVDYQAFVAAVSDRTAAHWRNRQTAAGRTELYWRLTRMQAAPYFVLGARHDYSPLRYRVGTPWDFKHRHQLRMLDLTPGRRGQPSVDWRATIDHHDGTAPTVVHGHVEIRWSHGKLNGSPEAKIYLDSDPTDVPGYDRL